MKKTTEQFISEANKVHNNKYDYSKTEYINAHSNIIVICYLHKEFEIKAYAHLNKQGCRQCGYLNRKIPHKKTTEQFLKQLPWNYDFSKTEYVNKQTKVKYNCNKHGEIEQYPTLLLKHGCPYCSGRGISKHSQISFINIANAVHDYKYDYTKTNFVRMSDDVTIVCKIHGEFIQRAGNHIHLKNGCPQCVYCQTSSKEQINLTNYIKSNYNDMILENDRKILDGKEIDIYLPDLKLGIEYHGIYWHLETVVGKLYHYNKWKLANEKGIRLIQVYSNEWLNKPEIIKSKVFNFLGKSKRVYARKTKIVELDVHLKDEFLTINHLQGSDGSKVAYGLIYGDELVACMTFGASRFNRSFDYEMIRFCNKNFHHVVGGASKLLSHFRKKNNGSIITYADKRYSDGELYNKIGFTLDGETKPSFMYFNIKTNQLYNRMKFQKQFLINENGYDDKLSEYEIMQLNGYDRIWDVGQYRFIMNRII